MENVKAPSKPQICGEEGKQNQSYEKLMIPKHRFDCVNLCLKETKQALKEKISALEDCFEHIKQLKKALLETKVEVVLAIERAKDLTAAKALINFSKLKEESDGTISGLKEQILRLKERQGFLFEEQEQISYVLIPVASGDALNRSIANYLNKIRRAGK